MRTRILLILFFNVTIYTTRAQSLTNVDTVRDNPYLRSLGLPLIIRSPETDWGFGFAGAYFFKYKKHEDSLRTSDFNIAAVYTLKKQLVVAAGATIFFPGEKKIFRLNSSYSYYPDKFWGTGNYSPREGAENYSLRQYFVNPQLLYKLYFNFYIGGTYEFQHVADFKYEDGGNFTEGNIASRTLGNTSGIGALITWDTRNHAFTPTRGSFAELNITRFNKLIGSDYRFTTFTLDMRKFIPLHSSRVLALQALMKLNRGTVPFRNLSFLGGAEMMRGYYKGRFADNSMMAYQAEVRQFLFWRIGVTGFAAVGQVVEDYGDFSFTGFHFAYGGGLRILLKKKEELNLRIDYGRGRKSDGVYVFLKEAF